MTSHVRIGDNRIFTLQQAVLLYQDGNTTFATLHEVKSPHEGAPYLGAGQSVTTGFLEKLARGSEPGTGGVATQHTVKDAGADRLVESGEKSTDVLRCRPQRHKGVERPNVSPPCVGVHG